MNKKEKIKLIIMCILTILVAGGAVIAAVLYYKKDMRLKEEERIATYIEEVTSHYAKYVKTNKDASIYTKNNEGQYVRKGTVFADEELVLEENLVINENTKYFYVQGMDAYIEYVDVDKIEALSVYAKGYNYDWYVPFNENITTRGEINIYNIDGKKIYSTTESLDLPIIIKDKDKYYVEYNNKLVYVLSSDVTIRDNVNSDKQTRNNVRVLAYHFIVDDEKSPNLLITHTVEQFESHIKYLKDNNYFTMSVKDMELFLDGKINIPKNTTMITIDDGAYLYNAAPILEKYEVRATAFIITSWFNLDEIPKSEYLDWQSHTDNMHNEYKCPGGSQGGELLCADKERIIYDLETSIEKTGGATALAYPFYDYNDRLIEILKEVGITLGFAGRAYKMGIASVGTNKYVIPRYTLWNSHTLNDFISLVK